MHTSDYGFDASVRRQAWHSKTWRNSVPEHFYAVICAIATRACGVNIEVQPANWWKQVKQIDKDLNGRTAPGHLMSKTEAPQNMMNALRRVLITFAFANPETGYCQAMAELGFTLLLTMTEEETYWQLYFIYCKYLPDHITTLSVPPDIGCTTSKMVVMELFKEVCPNLYEYIGKDDDEMYYMGEDFTGYRDFTETTVQ